ncbi:metal-sulfur cluster assembly factor [Actinophytocola sp.]|uniref:metal-sulfur cluster assembly factor n=1 Tax=Actinophytocola sp. TaxID=1872138 RepID=UPI003D6BAF04
MGRLTTTSSLDTAVLRSLEDIQDPHLPASLVDLGMIVGVRVSDATAHVELCLPCTSCPAVRLLEEEVVKAAQRVEGVHDVEVRQAWERPWRRDAVTPRAVDALREIGVQL